MKLKPFLTVILGALLGVALIAAPAAGQPAAAPSPESAGVLFTPEAPEVETTDKPVPPEGTPVQLAAEPTPVAPAPEAVRAPAPAPAPAAAPAAPQPIAEVSEITKPNAGGVIPRLRFDEDVTKFLKMLSGSCQKNIIASPQVRGRVTVDLFDVTCQEALDAVLTVNGFVYEEKGPFIFVYTKKEMAEMQAAKRLLENRVFELNYVAPADVEKLILPLLGTTGKVTSSPDAGRAEAQAGEKWAGKNVLVVQAFPDQLEQIAQVVKQMDQRPPQVLVEATILAVSLEDTNQLGIDLMYSGGVNFEFLSGGGVSTIPSAAGADSGVSSSFTGNLNSGGLTLGVTSNNVGLLLRALESTTDVTTLGNPKVLALNRQMSKMIVGKRDGYITTEVSQTTATQTVQFLETGTQLTFRPFIMSDGYIRMELNPKDSDGGVTVQGSFTLPSEKTTEVTTNVLVKDGHTVVIGGLFRDKTQLTRSQVPFVGSIPGLGALFRSTDDSIKREEVVFLITPHIVQEATDYAAARQALANANNQMFNGRRGLQWFGRERLAETYYHQAKQCQTEGKLDKARWNANCAAGLSPLFLDAQQLRAALVGEQVYRGEHSSMHTFMQQLLLNP